MSALPPCPKCNSEFTYEDGSAYDSCFGDALRRNRTSNHARTTSANG
ncbi:hypothetical protein [Trinickia diaoshuihuensis]